MARRRSAHEWASLIREFEGSGETAASFAGKRGIRKDTLVWWRWRLGRQGQKAAKRAVKATPPARVQLVAVDPVSDGRRPYDNTESYPDTPAWEIVAPSGYIVRVYQRDSIDVLRVAVAAIARGQRR